MKPGDLVVCNHYYTMNGEPDLGDDLLIVLDVDLNYDKPDYHNCTLLHPRTGIKIARFIDEVKVLQ